MKGLKLSKLYYEEHGRPMIEREFKDFAQRIACGQAGEGSENFGFDDEYSQDHDFGAGFCMWLTDDVFEEIGENLNEKYEALPGSFMGYEKKPTFSHGDRREGAMRISDFYLRYLGLPRAPETLGEWRAMPESFLAIATNGEVFNDPVGEFTKIRNELLAFYPEDIRLKKLAVRIGKMAQAGQYNFPRLMQRSEKVAAIQALAEFISNAISAVYLLNKKYMPFYKWAHHGMKNLKVLTEAGEILSRMADLLLDNSKISTSSLPNNESPACVTDEVVANIEKISILVADELRSQKLTDETDAFLLNHCDSVVSRIEHPALKAMHVLAE